VRRTGGAQPNAATPVDTYDEFFLAEFAGVLRLCHGLLGDRARAEEVTQEAFIRVYTNWARIAGYDRPDAWVRRVAIRLALRVRDRDRRRWALEHAFSRDRAEPEVPSATDVLALTDRLPRNQRVAVLLRYVDDLSIPDIATVLGCSEGTARVHLHRGRQRLAELLEGGTA